MNSDNKGNRILRCFFVGNMNNFEYRYKLAEQIDHELDSLIRCYDACEFWFTSVNCDYMQVCVGRVIRLNENNPEKNISIVRVVDPLRSFDDGINDAIPYGVKIDIKDVQAPMMDSKELLDTSRFMAHHNKINRWAITQCNCIFLYYYSELPTCCDRHIIKTALKQKDAITIRLGFPETAEFIKEQTELITEERRRTALKMMAEGAKLREIGEKLGVSSCRAAYLAADAGRYISYELKKRKYAHDMGTKSDKEKK